MRLVAALLGLVLAATLGGPAVAGDVVPPPVGVRFDYQLGGAVAPPSGVGIVTRDRTEPPAGDYAICYVNGFQTQASEKRFWRRHWGLVLKKNGRAVEDSAWGEWLLDVRTPRKRAKLTRIVGGWIDGCAASGYDAVELDNLDSWTRSKHLLTRKQAVAFARLLVARAHAAGLAVGQKNTPQLGVVGPAIGFDFAVAEQCGQYDECERYTSDYGREVLAIEYDDALFAKACAAIGGYAAVERRDRALSPDGPRAWC